MKTTQLIALSASIAAFAAPAAVARPVVDPPATTSGSVPAAVQSGPAGKAAHHEQIANAQWQRRQPQPGATVLVDRTQPDSGTPMPLLAIIGVSLTLALLLMQLSGKGVAIARARRRTTAV